MNWKEKLKHEFDVNPIQTIAVGAMVATAAAKLFDSLSSMQSRNAYARQINMKAKK